MEVFCCCDCKGYVDVFRCEQVAANVAALWNSGQPLPAVFCDAGQSAVAIDTATPWVSETASSASGGAMNVTLVASAITVTGTLLPRVYGTNFVEVGLFDNAITARLEVDVVEQNQWIKGYYPERIRLGSLTRQSIRARFTGDSYDPDSIELVAAVNADESLVFTAMVPTFGGRTDWQASGFGQGQFWHGISLADGLQARVNGVAIHSGFTSVAPTEFFGVGNEATTLRVYRDGQLVGTINKQDEQLSLSVSSTSSGVQVSGSGSYADPITGTVDFSTVNQGRQLTLVPSHSGVLRIRAVLSRYFGLRVSGAIYDRFGGTLRQSFKDASPFDEHYAVQAGQPFSVIFQNDYDNANAFSQQIITSIALTPHGVGTLLLSNDEKQLFSQQGSYYVVWECNDVGFKALDNSTYRSFTVSAPTVKSIQQLNGFVSFVVVTEKPAVAVRQINDEMFGSFDRLITEQSSVEAHLEDPAPVVKEVLPGQPVVDAAGNAAFLVETPQYNVWAAPPDGRVGAKSHFAMPEASHSLIYERPLAALRLTFDKPVAGVSPGMFSLVKASPPNGQQQQFSVGLRRASSLQEFDVLLPATEQTFNSQWKIVFTPSVAVAVISGSPQLYAAAGAESFPEQGSEGVVYHDSAQGVDYVWDGLAYRTLQQDDIAEIGTTKRAARFMWAIGKDKSVGRFLRNTSTEPARWMQKQITLTQTLRLNDGISSPPRSRIAASRDFLIPASGGRFRTALPLVGKETFAPRMPTNPDANQDGGTVVSYFGMSTTIYPAEPKEICEWFAPSSAQQHGALLLGNPTANSISVTLKKANSRILPDFFVDFSQSFTEYELLLLSSENGLPLPQNLYRLRASPNFTESNVYRLSGGNEVVQTSTLSDIDCDLNLLRAWKPYAGMATSTISQLVMQFSIRGTLVGKSGNTSFGSNFFLAKSQELSLAAGNAVDVEDTQGSLWTISIKS